MDCNGKIPSLHCWFCKLKIFNYLFQSHKILNCYCIKSNGYCETKCNISILQVAFFLIGFLIGTFSTYYCYNESMSMKNITQIHWTLNMLITFFGLLQIGNTLFWNIKIQDYVNAIRLISFLYSKLNCQYFNTNMAVSLTIKSRQSFKKYLLFSTSLLITYDFACVCFITTIYFLVNIKYVPLALLFWIHLHYCYIIFLELEFYLKSGLSSVQFINQSIIEGFNKGQLSYVFKEVNLEYNIYFKIIKLTCGYLSIIKPFFNLFLIPCCVIFTHMNINNIYYLQHLNVEEVLIWIFVVFTSIPVLISITRTYIGCDALLLEVFIFF